MDDEGNGTWRRRLRARVVDSPTSLGAAARRRRWEIFTELFPGFTEMRVVDLGGTVESWRRAPVRPREVVVVNLFEPGTSDDASIVPVTGDACAARQALRSAGVAGGFDLAFSNSLVEHVGGHSQRAALAEEIRALAPRHWVQTPYRYFPVEPHWLFPFMQFLPMTARARVATTWPLVHTLPETREEAMTDVQWTELIGIAELRSYFPDSRVVHEKLGGLTKSIIAVRT